ncbi:MAG: 50S ribosomal protein L5 [Patescibacteria group bacterium]|jgi:large subunit ribosomal protein L5
MNRLQQQYINEIAPALKKELGLSNVELIPRITKVTINVGAGDAHTNKSIVESISKSLKLITGQSPVVNNAKKAISAFKIREGNAVGLKVTLRGERMYDFIDKVISITIPRLRDFRGLSRKAVDGHGNYNFGFKENTVFVEIPYDTNTRVHGVQVCVTTTAKTDADCIKLLEMLGFPFTKLEHKEQ